MAIVNPVAYLQAGTYPASLDRLHQISMRFLPTALSTSDIACRGGVLGGQSSRQFAFSMTNWDVTVGKGAGLVENTFTSQGGDYSVFNTANQVLTVTASSPTTNRIDIVGVRVQDAFYTGAINSGDLAIVQGTPAAGSPAAPTLPASFLPLVQVTVNAGTTTGILVDLRKRTATMGSVYVPFTTQLADAGTMVGETQLIPATTPYPARLRSWDGTAWRGASSFAFDQPAQSGSGTLNVATDLTLKSLSVPDPGYAYRIVGGGAVDWAVIAGSSPLQLMVASITIDSTTWNVGQIAAGFQVSHSASGGSSQPTAIAEAGNSTSQVGAHTVRLISRNGGGTAMTVPVSALTRLNVTVVPA